MKIIKYLAIIGFIGLLTVSCEKDPKPTDELQKIAERKLPVVGIYEFNHGPQGKMPFVFKETSYRGFMEKTESQVTRVYINTKGDIHKAVLKNPTPNKDGKQFRTLFFRSITENSVEIHQDYTFKTEKEAVDSKYPSPDEKPAPGGPGGHSAFGWIPLTKSADQTEPPIDPGDTSGTIKDLNGKYLSEFLPNKVDPSKNAGQYQFKIGQNDEAFLFMGDMYGEGEFTVGASLKLSRKFTDESKGQLIYEITDATGYYGPDKKGNPGRKGEFLTLYAKNIASDGSSADFAIATKGGVKTIAASEIDVIGKTLEEAKTIAPPGDNDIWQKDMMKYAHVWISTTKE